MKNLWQNLMRFFGNETPPPPEKSTMNTEFLRKMVDMSLNSEDEEIDCDACFEMLDQYIELLEEGSNPAEVLPELEQHLAVCHCCEVELTAILTALRVATDETANQ